jgi:hypothetical protein
MNESETKTQDIKTKDIDEWFREEIEDIDRTDPRSRKSNYRAVLMALRAFAHHVHDRTPDAKDRDRELLEVREIRDKIREKLREKVAA